MNTNFLTTKQHLGDHLEDPHRNNFGLIRLIAALMVMETHSHILSAEDQDLYYRSSFHVSFLGLPSFFFLSGLLVTQSLYKSPSWQNFLWKRFLRIYPAPSLSILAAAFIMGPLVTTCSLHDYFTSPALYRYLETCSLLHINFQLPGVFTHSALGTDSVNSSLWTIALELKLYIGLLIAWMLKIPGKKILLLILIAVAIITFHFLNDGPIRRLLSPWLTLGTHFFFGILAYLYKDKIVLRSYWLIPILLAFIISIRLGILYSTGFVLVPALVLFSATHGVRFLQRITPKADLSYGIYVFAFPVQQLVANYLHPANPFILFVLSVIAVLPLAILSWYGVERPALRLKNKVR